MSDAPLDRVLELAEQTVAYVQRALGVRLEYDSDTLPVLDHYLRGVPTEQAEIVELVVVTAGAYFGEVVRRSIGGRWELEDEPRRWHFVLPSAVQFSPAGMVAAAISQSELADHETMIDAPARIRPHVQEALGRMGQISQEEYFSLCGRLDTLEHLHEVLVTTAAAALGDAPDPDEDAPAEGAERDAPAGGAPEASDEEGALTN